MKFLFGFLIDLLDDVIALCDSGLLFLNYLPRQEGVSRSLWVRFLALPLSMVLATIRALVWILASPFAGLNSDVLQRERNFYLGIPAILGFMTCLGGVLVAFVKHGEVRERYKSQMLAAMRSGEFQLASMIGSRLMEDNTTSDPDLSFNYALALGKSGEQSRALSMIQSLAPDDKPGYPPAHRTIALGILPSLQKEVSGDLLKKIRFHLEQCGEDKSDEIQKAWSVYYVRVGQTDQAIKSLKSIPNPDIGTILLLADLYASQKNTTASVRGWQQAREELEKKLAREPQSTNTSLLLAQVHGKLGDLDAAEKVLRTSMTLSSDERIKTSIANLYLVRDEQAMNNKSPIRDRLQFIRTAIELAPNSQAGYDRLIDLCAANPKSEETGEVKRQLEEMIVDGKNPSFAHFALSSILFASSGASDKARWHLEQAFALDSSLSVVANNLAWLMAHSVPKKLDEAENLSRRALAAQDTPAFRDTLGTILLYQEKYTEAARELELALKDGLNNRSIHAKLAKVYQQLGNDSLAQLHAQRAGAKLTGK